MKSASSRAVFVKPGITLFTVIPNRPSSLASVFVQFAIAARTVFDTPRPLIGVKTEVLVMLMMRPYPASRMSGAHACVHACAQPRCIDIAAR